MAKRKSRKSKKAAPKRARRGYKRKPKAQGFLGLESVALPREEISRGFRKFTRPVSPTRKRPVYAFVEVSASYGGISMRSGATAVLPVKIGRLTRGELVRMSEEELRERLRAVLPGTEVLRLAGFGHDLPLHERRGKKFKKARPRVRVRHRKTRRKGASRGR